MKDSALERKWTIMSKTETISDGERGAEHSNAVWFENTLIYGVADKGLTSLYVGNHEIRWELPIPHGVQSQILIERQVVYFGGGDGFLYSVNVETGRVNWRYDLHNPIISKPNIIYIVLKNNYSCIFTASSSQGHLFKSYIIATL